ncbi:hypothetical protein Tco_0422734 [Tanacetum coccineum]
MLFQAHEEMGEGSEIPTDPHHTPTITQPSSSQRQRKQKSRKSKKKNTEVPQPSGSTKNVPDENVPTTSNDPLLSGENRLKLIELMDLCTNLQKKVLDLEKAKITLDSEIASLKKKVKKLERRNKSRTLGLKRLRKVGLARRVESSDKASLGDQEDASKQGRKIVDIDTDEEVTLIDETYGRNDNNLMFDTDILDEQEVEVEKVVRTAEVTTKSATITTTPTTSKPLQDKDKEKMIKFEQPLKKKDQIMYDQEVALNLQAQLQDELEEEERLTRQKDKEADITLIESWDNTQAIMDADYQMAQQLQAEEQEQLSTKEKEDLETLWKLVKAKHGSTRPEEGYERVLWGDLMTMFELDVEKKRYPFTPAIITCMLNKKLQADHWNEMCYQLLKLITKQLKNPGSGSMVGIKSFIRLFGITAALIKGSAAQEERVNAAGTKLQLLTELQLLMDKDCLCDMYKIFL